MWRVEYELVTNQGHIIMTTSRAVADVCTYFTFQERQFSKFIKSISLYLLLLKRSTFATACLMSPWAQKLATSVFISFGQNQATDRLSRHNFLISPSIFAFLVSKTDMRSTMRI